MDDYTTHPSLDGIVLEESYVLSVRASPGSLAFDMDFALAADHPDYAPPFGGVPFCTRTGTLTFVGVTSLVWNGQGAPPATDAAGEQDFGNIDSLKWDSSHYVLEGDWGHIDVDADRIEIVLVPS